MHLERTLAAAPLRFYQAQPIEPTLTLLDGLVERLQRVAAERPDSAQVWRLLGRTLALRGRDAQPDTHFDLARVLVRKLYQQFFYTRGEARPQDNRSRLAALGAGIVEEFWVALAFLAEKDPARRIDYLDRALSRCPHHALAYLLRASRRRDQQGRLADYTAALSINDRLLPAWCNRAQILVSLGRWQEAIADAEQAMRRAPRLARPYVLRGQARSGLGQWREARADFDRAIELDPTESLAYYNRAVLRSGRGEQEPALADLALAVRHNSRPHEAHAARSKLLRRLGRRSDGLAAIELALEIAPVADHHNTRGMLRQQLGDRTGAAADYDAALALDPDHVNARSNRGALRVLPTIWPATTGRCCTRLAPGRSWPCATSSERSRSRRATTRAATCAATCTSRWVAALVQRGICKGKLADHTGAVADLQRTTTLAPRQWAAWHNYGARLAEAGRRKEARLAIDRALRHARIRGAMRALKLVSDRR